MIKRERLNFHSLGKNLHVIPFPCIKIICEFCYPMIKKQAQLMSLLRSLIIIQSDYRLWEYTKQFTWKFIILLPLHDRAIS